MQLDDVKPASVVTTALEQAAEDVKAAKTNWDRLDVPIEHSGRAITLPGDPAKMPLQKAIEALQRKAADEEQPYDLHEVIEAYPLDAAVAFVKAMQRLYGFASPTETMTMFGPRPPQMISVKTGPKRDDVIQCPIGAFKLPGLTANVNATIVGDQNFVIHGKFKKKDRHILLELARETRDIVAKESIYRAKALRLGVTDDGKLDVSRPPEFMDVSDTSESSLIFDDEIMAQIDTNILVPIKHTVECKKNKIPLKRGVLLEGPYGTGKSLTARMTASVCERYGWTFILLDKVQGLRVALKFANRYAPAVVFAEDIDRIAQVRDEAANDLINTIDGVVSKRSEIMTILTTNFAEKLNPVILRPGRLDAVISLRAPSPKAVQGLLRMYGGNLIAADELLENAGIELAGQIPATIRECVDRAKMSMIGRGDRKLRDGDLVVAAQTMKNHLNLLNRKVAEETQAEKLASALRNVVAGTGDTNAEEDDVHTITKDIRRLTRDIHSNVC